MLGQLIGGFVAGFMAGLIGFLVDSAIGATFQALSSAIPAMVFLGLVYSIVSFFAGLEEAYVAGIFFSFGVIAGGFVLQDWIIGISGIISLSGTAIGWLKHNTD